MVDIYETITINEKPNIAKHARYLVEKYTKLMINVAWFNKIIFSPPHSDRERRWMLKSAGGSWERELSKTATATIRQINPSVTRIWNMSNSPWKIPQLRSCKSLNEDKNSSSKWAPEFYFQWQFKALSKKHTHTHTQARRRKMIRDCLKRRRRSRILGR